MEKNDLNPPGLATKLLLWFLKPELAEEVQGDLEEKFQLCYEQQGITFARRNYWYQVLNYLRPFAIRRSIFSFSNHSAMFKHTILLTYRSFFRHTGAFLINLASLSIGLSVALFIYLWIQDELSMDKFHEHESQLFQVMKHAKQPDGMVFTFEWTPGPLARTLKDEMPEVELAASSILYEGAKKGIVIVGDKRVKAIDQYASEDYFKMFSYDLLEGNINFILSKKEGVAISDELAFKLFSRKNDLIGETVEWEQGDLSGLYEITGVFKKPPRQSTAQFDLVFNYDRYLDVNPDVNSWSYGGPDTYVLLNEATSLSNFNSKLENYLQKKSKEDYQYLFARKYSDQYLYNHYEGGEQVGGRIGYVKLFGAIAMLILIIACINFMNLATAKASRRMKEIGVKKTFGVSKKTLVFQFLMEALFMVILSLIVSLLLIYLILPSFNNIVGKPLVLSLSSTMIYTILAIAIITGLLSGSYPAFYLSGITAITVLKGKFNQKGGALMLRRGLVVFQYCISFVLMVMVLIVYQQITYLQSKELGYNKDNLILFKKEGAIGDKITAFLDDIKQIPGVLNASNFRNDLLVNGTRTLSINWEGMDAERKPDFKYLTVNYDLLETLDIQMKEGRSFSKEFGDESTKIIFNQKAIDKMGLENPIGKTIQQARRKKQIIGVVENFHFESLYEEVYPCFIQLSDDGDNILVRAKAGNEKGVIENIKEVYQRYNPGLAFEYEFMDEVHREYYAAESRIASLSKYAMLIAILISCLGLFGLVAFTADQRKKEIGIRKVLGASVLNLTNLISKEFIVMVCIAILIAAPISYFTTQYWLGNFAYSIDLHLGYFLFSAAIVLLTAWITVSIQTVKAAVANPVEVLKSE